MPNIQEMILLAPGILLALAFHEYAHGWVADKLGDPTARMAGRLTMNPLVHLDIMGTLMLFLAQIGWAKPVPINPYNFHNPRRDIILVSTAGVTANMIMAAGWGLIFRFLASGIIPQTNHLPAPIWLIIVLALQINLMLAVFNLIPVPPLDGSRILGGLLPEHLEREYRKLDQFGPFLILILVIGGSLLHIPILGYIITPFVRFFAGLFAGIPNLI